MKTALLPFNIKILDAKTIPWKLITPVTSLDIYDGLTTELNDKGLYSIPIFGRVGSEERDDRYSYIHIKSSVFHPDIYNALVALKQLYAGVLSGSVWAKWDDDQKDFVKSTQLEGQTGYAFFLSHWKSIEFKRNESPKRSDNIELVEKFKDVALYRNVLVTPAGLRDIEIDPRGRTTENEVNSLYRKLLSAANTITDDLEGANTSLYDGVRWTLQQRFNEIYQNYADMLEGKRGILQQKWGRRRIFNGTRNVITAAKIGCETLGAANSPHMDDTQIGLLQLARGALPLTIYGLLNGWLKHVFTDGTRITVVNPKTLTREVIDVDQPTVTKWTTKEGLEKLIYGFKDTRLRNKPITIQGRYLGLTYADNDHFRVFGDITELPEGWNPGLVHPLTYTELLYLCLYKRWNTLYMVVTRYPITGMGSVYQTRAYVKTTVKATIKVELDENWQPIEDGVALEFPVHDRDASFMDSMSVHPSRLGLLGGDYDGDTMSAIVLLGDDVLRECERLLNERESFITGRGEFLVDVTNDTVDFVLKALTGYTTA